MDVADRKRVREALARMKNKLAAMHGIMRVTVAVRPQLATDTMLTTCECDRLISVRAHM